VLGFVGAGGIGKELISSIRQFYYADVSAILVIIIGTVFLIDWLTEMLRHRLIGIVGDTR
jgi:phosphonate transport system permease protein